MTPPASNGCETRRVLALCGDMVVVYGMERMTFEVLRVLRESGVEVHCIVNDWENHRIRPLADSIGASSSAGFYGYALQRTLNPLRLFRYLVQVGRTSLGLLREQRRFRATHIFAPEFGAVLKNAPALLILKAFGVPTILRLPVAPSREKFYRALWGWVVAPLVSTVVVQSEFMLSRCEQVGVPDKKKVLIRNAIPRRELARNADREVVELARQRRTLVCLGQVAPFKGTHLAVEATLALLDRGEDVQLIVAGPIPKWPADRVEFYEGLRREVAARGHEERVHFVGAVSNVFELMEASFVLLVPVLGEESFCLVVLEAMYSGLPVVGFKLGAVPELVEHERTGYLCRGLDRDSLIEGIEYFLSDSETRARVAAASRCAYRASAKDFAPEVFARGWREVFSV